jgi:hypothetical protein
MMENKEVKPIKMDDSPVSFQSMKDPAKNINVESKTKTDDLKAKLDEAIKENQNKPAETNVESKQTTVFQDNKGKALVLDCLKSITIIINKRDKHGVSNITKSRQKAISVLVN